MAHEPNINEQYGTTVFQYMVKRYNGMEGLWLSRKSYNCDVNVVIIIFSQSGPTSLLHYKIHKSHQNVFFMIKPTSTKFMQ
jgi:hypothetical protein